MLLARSVYNFYLVSVLRQEQAPIKKPVRALSLDVTRVLERISNSLMICDYLEFAMIEVLREFLKSLYQSSCLQFRRLIVFFSRT